MSNTLNPGKTLNKNESLTSTNGKYALKMQADGNLVLYKGTQVLWSSKTNHTDADHATMQADGNFVVYDAGNTPHWASGTNGKNNNPYLILQDDGNLVIYYTAPSWASGTNQ
jgi:hypothetical protein